MDVSHMEAATAYNGYVRVRSVRDIQNLILEIFEHYVVAWQVS